MADAAFPPVQCAFYVREQVTDAPTYRYERIWMRDKAGDGHLATPYPPLVGDLIDLIDQDTVPGGVFQVVQRSWSHAQLGSAYWPYTSRYPEAGPTLEIIVERAEGLFHDEAELAEDGDDNG
jgi:hypothetical protein